MDKKKKIILAVVGLSVVGFAFYMWKKSKQKQIIETGAGTSQSKISNPNCMGGKASVGGGKGKLISVAGVLGSEGRKKATKVFKKGMMVSVDGGKPTKIIGMWKDKNKQVGALKLANKVSDGKTICW